jgi:type IV pilus modification protein PilV
MRPQTGFTLLEMMISLLVLAVGVLGLLRLQTELLHSQMAANDYNTATNLAQAVLEQRHNGALVDCAQADYAAFRGKGALSRFRCRREETNNTITVYMQWTDSQGDENTLRLSAPTVLNVVPPPAK